MIPVVFPLIALILPIIVIRRAKTNPVKDAFVYSFLSFTCSFIALLQEIYTIYRRIMHNDLGGVEDTIGAVMIISIGIVLVTLFLNFIALYASYRKDNRL